jgi:hypothetical protein
MPPGALRHLRNHVLELLMLYADILNSLLDGFVRRLEPGEAGLLVPQALAGLSQALLRSRTVEVLEPPELGAGSMLEVLLAQYALSIPSDHRKLLPWISGLSREMTRRLPGRRPVLRTCSVQNAYGKRCRPEHLRLICLAAHFEQCIEDDVGGVSRKHLLESLEVQGKSVDATLK